MQPHQQRVVDEKESLDEKIEKLISFVDGSVFSGLPQDEQGRMLKQLTIMHDYAAVLGDRINAFPADQD